ncbi:DNA cytosine methyltransferase [Salmonella enterica subsp. enterica]
MIDAIRYGSVCSGIEAASVAWESLGWKPAWFSEIDRFPSAVLNHHWPEVDNLGDMRLIPQKVLDGDIEAPPVFVGGTPCQGFSVAGLGLGMDDERSQLTLHFVKIANAIDEKRQERNERPSIIVWENVPGVLSDRKTNGFGNLLAGLAGENAALKPAGGKWTNAGYIIGPKRCIAWRVLDAQYFRVAQRRRRVFVVAGPRDGFDPGAVLFELGSMCRHSPPLRTPGKGPTGNSQTGTNANGKAVGSHWDDPCNPHPTLNQSNNIGGIGLSNQELFAQRDSGIVGVYRMAAFGQYADDETASTCKARDFKDATDLAVERSAMHRMLVRRLTPVECERLQGFPDLFTRIPWRGKLAENCPDGHRYKALGNSMAVPVMKWLGEQINKQLIQPANQRAFL